MEEGLKRTFTEAPSFGRTCDAAPGSPSVELEVVGNDDLPMNDFEFAFTLDESTPSFLTTRIAGETFSNDQALPVYPVFNRNLVDGNFESSPEQELSEKMGRLALPLEKHDLRSGSVSSSSSISSEADDPAAYCAWTPRYVPHSPNRWRMSRSTGSETSDFRRFRLRDLFISRSRSDGMKKLMAFQTVEKGMGKSGFCPISSRRATTVAETKSKNGKGKRKGKGGEEKKMDVVTAHQIYYGREASASRRSFLPYRQGLLGGFFGDRKHLS